MKLIENDYLAWLIIQYLGECNYLEEGDFYHAADWLSLSSNLESVDISPGKYDEGLLYCGTAWDFENSRSKLLSTLCKELVRFHFVWGALESIVVFLVPSDKIEKYGKINALCGFLKGADLTKLLPQCYLEEFSRLLTVLRNMAQYKEDLIKIGMSLETKHFHGDYVDVAGIGIFVVYKIRNKFAHGTMHLPLPEDYSLDSVHDLELVIIATRIILMTILMLLINDIKNNDFFFDPEESLIDAGAKSAVEYIRDMCVDR